MAMNITATIVAWETVPQMIENGWEFIVYNPTAAATRSTGQGVAILVKQGSVDTLNTTGEERDMLAKRGETAP